jgi:hypothetical protein
MCKKNIISYHRPAHNVQYKLNWTSQKPNRANKRLKHDDDDYKWLLMKKYLLPSRDLPSKLGRLDLFEIKNWWIFWWDLYWLNSIIDFLKEGIALKISLLR